MAASGKLNEQLTAALRRKDDGVTGHGLSAPLRHLADLAEIRGDSIEVTAWRRLAGDLDELGPRELERLRALVDADQLGALAHLPPGLHATFRDLMIDGPDAAITTATSTVPVLLSRLLDFGTVDTVLAAALARAGIVTLPDLEAALLDGRISQQFPDIADRLRIGVDALAFDRPLSPIGRAYDLADNFVRLIGGALPDLAPLVPAGDLRRCEPLVESLIAVGSAIDPPSAIEAICGLPMLQPVRHRTTRRALVTYQRTEVDVRIAAPDEFGTALFWSTGSRTHASAMRARHGNVRLCAREEDVYSQAGLAWIPPEMRHGTGEIEAAAAGTLPALVAREHIRGDLHMHTTYSDGGDTLAAMIQACAALGYEYIAITDHSERAGASRTVSLAALDRQRAEIERLRGRFPQMAILHGVEVDIMPDGRLDFPDAVLETLDIVLASLHDGAGHDSDRLTRRCLAAIEHPLVNVITHPANRLVGRSVGYALDFEAIYAAAAESGTALEIDGAPSHLDLDGEHARDAVAAGVTVTIDSDCHRARLLDKQMHLGIGTARRGWVEPRHVLNARPLDEVRAFIARKRQRSP
jgi:DNA polymerase (family X)